MRTLEITSASRPLGEYAGELGEETIIVTSNKKPVAALVSLQHLDRETISLSTSSEFRAIIDASRAEVREGKTLSAQEMRLRLG